MEESIVKEYLIGAGYDEKAVRKYYKPDHPAPLSDILGKAESIIEKISVDDDRINEIENATREQSRNSQWHAERFPRITASKWNEVQPCGLFVSKSHPFLGASPDGLVGDNGFIEVKKIHPQDSETLETALLRLNIVKATDSINENHP
ncbi:hypothetical protein AWC38_SpisGene22578 [Stylophora pistillata]|uniref:YqaJ viral recombinase domain-containing protein n=1 Tax=Stylophora pistillata TaxID=50429 RepID=A0A2B4RAU0_STYPI|nr:hypothetical protein AWC38_SpisGene22578 [Stylophora pistillata]